MLDSTLALNLVLSCCQFRTVAENKLTDLPKGLKFKIKIQNEGYQEDFIYIINKVK